MLSETLPILDVFFNVNGGLTTDIYGTTPVDISDPEDSYDFFIETLAEEFVFCCTEEESGLIEDPVCVQQAYNLLDSLYAAIKIIEDKIYED